MIQQHPDYAEGFWDAAAGVPIWFEECSPAYAAGWKAFWKCKSILRTMQEKRQ